MQRLIIIDQHVQGYKEWLDPLVLDGCDVLSLDPNQGGLQQIATFLRERVVQYDSLDIVSHGSDAQVFLGADCLNLATLNGFADQLHEIGSYLTAEGDIKLYGCNIAKTDQGYRFIELFASLTGADVAASSNLSGSKLANGDSNLEVSIGNVESALLNLEDLPVTLLGNNLPVGDVTITGTLAQNETLMVTPGFADVDGIGLIGYTWMANGVVVGVGTSYTLSQNDVGKQITVIASYTDALGSKEYVTSSASAIVTDTNAAPTFNIGSGFVVSDLGGIEDKGRSIAVQVDGKVVVASYQSGSFAVIRYRQDGALDTTFGQAGISRFHMELAGDYAESVLLQADGKILVAGHALNANASAHVFALARLNSDGSLDSTFSDNGKLTTAIGSGNSYGQSIALQSDGRILVAGYSSNGNNDDFAVARYTSDGTLDLSFGNSGYLTTPVGSGSDQAYSIAVQSDGGILVAGTGYVGSSNDFALVRYTSIGVLDTTFSGDGLLTTAISAGDDSGHSVLVQPDGKILVAGYTYDISTGYNFAITRYTATGLLDTSFSGDGIQTTSVSLGHDYAYSLTLQPDGKILVAGSSDGDFALLRYNSDGSLDTSFSGDGIQRTAVRTDIDQAQSVALQPDGKILVTGYSYSAGGSAYDVALVRYNADGSLDTTFNVSNTLDGAPAYTENGTAVVLDSNAQIFDADLSAVGSYAGATLTLARHNGSNSDDQFSGVGIVAGQASGNVTVASTVVGTYVYSSGLLQVAFNSAASQSLVNQVLQAIAYKNTSDAPPVSVQLDWTFSDVNSGAQGVGGVLNVTGSTNVAISPVNDAPTGSVLIAGTVAQGQVLTASNSLGDADGLGAISYAWKANGVQVGTGVSYTLTQSEVGKSMTLVASYVDAYGKSESVLSATSSQVSNINDSPAGSVFISGALAQGQTLSASNNITDADGLGSVAYSWKANGQFVGSGNSYTLTQSEVGKTITVTAAYTDALGTAESVSSSVSQPVSDANVAPTFYVSNGIAVTDIVGSAHNGSYSMAVQPNGKILLAGYSSAGADADFAVVRYNNDGSLDTTFGSNGKLVTSCGTGADYAYSIKVQGDGKILVGGTSFNGSSEDFALVRYDIDGTLDTAFSGDGKVTTAFSSGTDEAKALAIQSDGKILLAGDAYVNGRFNLAIARYNSDGSLDTSFSADGLQTVSVAANPYFDTGSALAVQSDGKAIVAGSGNGDFELVRFNSDGSLDTSFSGDGKQTASIGMNADYANTMAIQADGKILVAGYSSNYNGSGAQDVFSLARFNTDGSLDTGFSGDGKQTTAIGTGGAHIHAIAVQADGKVVAVGNSISNGKYYITVARYGTDGNPDTTFGTVGIVTTGLGTYDDAYSVVVQSDGKILVSGITRSAADNDFIAIRYNSDGSVDTTFGMTNRLDGAPSYTEGGTNVVLDNNVLVFDQDLSAFGNYAGSTVTLARHGGASADDFFASTGVVSSFIESSAIVLSGTIVGTVVKNSAGTLSLRFNTNATQGIVNQVLQSIAYSNASDAPQATAQIDWIFADGNTAGLQGVGGVQTVTGSTTVTLINVNDAPTLQSLSVAYADTASNNTFVQDRRALQGADLDHDELTYGIQNGTLNGDICSYVSTYGVLELNVKTGVYTYTPNNSAMQGLKTNTVEPFVFTVSDGKTIVSADLKVNIAGADDPTTFSGDLFGVVRVDDENNCSGRLNVLDRDAGDGLCLIQVGTAGRYGTFNIAANGQWSYALNPNLHEVQSLQTTETLTEVFTAVSSGGGKVRLSIEIKGSVNNVPVFSNDYGLVTTPIFDAEDRATDLVVQQDGKFILAGYGRYGGRYDFASARYNADGSLDTSYGVLGKRATGVGSADDYGLAAVIDSQGRTLIVGVSDVGTSSRDIALVRFDSTGNLDSSFSGDGKQLTNISTWDSANDVVLQQDGKIVVVGGSGRFDVLRYNSSGTLDTSFSGDGIASTHLRGYEIAESVVVQVDGKILVAGGSSSGTEYDFALARYAGDGSLDTSFSADGLVSTAMGVGWDYANAMALQVDGKIVLAGYTNLLGSDWYGRDVALARYNSDGSLDASFGANGIVITELTKEGDSANAVAIQPDGKILVAGSAAYKIFLARYNVDGTLDQDFGTNGKVLTSIDGSAESLVQLQNGKIIVGGWAGSDFAVARFSANGTPDKTFGVAHCLEQGEAVLLDNNLTLKDVDLTALGSYSGSSLVLNRVGGAVSDDVFSGAGIQPDESNGSVVVDSTVVGTYEQQAGLLNISFGGAATEWHVNQVLRTLCYKYSGDAPPNYIDIQWTFSDGNTGMQGSGSSQSVTFTTGVVISAINDNPLGADKFINLALGTSYILSASSFGFSDAEDGSVLSAVRIDTLPSLGKVFYDGAWITTPGLVFARADLDNGLLTYKSNSPDSFSYSVRDSEGAFAVAPSVLSFGNNSDPIGSVSISGTLTQGQTLRVVSNITDSDGLGSVTYTWKQSSPDGIYSTVLGTGESLVLLETNVEKRISVVASYTDAHGVAERVTSAATGLVVNVNDLPTGSVSFTGSLVQGQVLYASNNVNDADGLGAISYSWRSSLDGVNWQNVGSGSTFLLTEAQVGKSIRLVAGYTDGHGSNEIVSSDVSAFVANVNDTPSGHLYIKGIPALGNNLRVSSTLGDLDGIGSVSYNWQSSSDGVMWNTIGTGISLDLQESVVGKYVQVTASYRDGHGTDESVVASIVSPVGRTSHGSNSDDVVIGVGASDRLLGGLGNDVIEGSTYSLASLLNGGEGNDVLNGVNRADIAEYSGNRSDYNVQISTSQVNVVGIRNAALADGADTLNEINLIKFADCTEFLLAASDRLSLSGDESDHLISVSASKLYGGTKAAETFVLDQYISPMILAGNGDTIQLAGSFADFTYAKLGSQLQIFDGNYMATINLGGSIAIKAADGVAEAHIGFANGSADIVLGQQHIGATDFDANRILG